MADITEIVDNSRISNKDSAISVLLPEILSRIFSFLPLADRKCVKLVSRAWYDSCISVDITKCEKFVFRKHFSIKDVNGVLMRSNYPLLNLEFQRLPVHRLPVDLWKVCGQRIRTLEFDYCQLNYKLISHIILHCENLTSFTITSLGIAEHTQLGTAHLLDDLIRNGIRRPKLHTLSMHMNGDVALAPPKSVLRRIFILYPSIKHFTISTPLFAYTFACRLTSHFVESSAFWELYRYLNDIIPKNNMYRTNQLTWMETLINAAEQGLKLKQLLSTFVYERSVKYTVDFFKSQRNLEAIHFRLVDTQQNNNDERKKIFFLILDNCPNLRVYRISPTFEQKILFEPSELPRLIAAVSKLKSMNFIFDVVDCEPTPSYHDLLSNSGHLSLTLLRWDIFNVNFDFCVAFLQRCSSLRHLNLIICNDTMLQIIFQYLTELRTLVVRHTTYCTDFGFTGRDRNGEQKGYSIERLQQLKYLELCRPIDDDSYVNTDMAVGFRKSLAQVALELHAPRLEFLSLDRGFYIELSEKDSSDLASQLPKLKLLTIEPIHDEYYQKKTVEFCKQFKNLHHLICCRESGIAGERLANGDISINHLDARLVKSLFSACPALRYITDYFGTLIFRNPFTGKVLHDSSRRTSNHPGSIFDRKFSALT